MAISYPEKNNIGAQHRVLLVSLGGASASSDTARDRVATLANDIAAAWNPSHPSAKILTVTGGASPFNSSRRITEEIIEICDRMLTVSKKDPKLVLIGKSMGGCKLHLAANRLAEESIEVDLFVSVDMSCFPGRHYDNYKEHKIDEKVYSSNVKSLVNFFQTKAGELQCGHVAVWNAYGSCKLKGPHQMCRDYNISVNEDFVRLGNDGEILFEGNQKICERVVGHLNIDSDPRLLAAIRDIIEKRVLIKLLPAHREDGTPQPELKEHETVV